MDATLDFVACILCMYVGISSMGGYIILQLDDFYIWRIQELSMERIWWKYRDCPFVLTEPEIV